MAAINPVSKYNGKHRQVKRPALSRYSAITDKLLSQDDVNRIFVETDFKLKPLDNFEVIDLFAGAGGMSLGFENAGFNLLSAVEVVEVAAETHKLNFPDCDIFCGDIKDYEPLKITKKKKVSVVVGGPPCQGFSVAGARNPNDPRNKLFREFVRVVDEVRPDYFVMENVPGILTMQQGKVARAIVQAFHDIGYENVSIAVLEAAQFGVPQLRSRAIFIGNAKGLPNPFPAPKFDQDSYAAIETAILDLPANTPIPEINHEWTRHSKDFISRISKVAPGESLYATFADAYKRQYLGVPSMTIKENHGGTHIHPTLNRCISAREMARLQSFPDSFIFAGPMKKAMWQIGNAVAPTMAENIARAILPFLNALTSDKEPVYKEWVSPQQELNARQLVLI